MPSCRVADAHPILNQGDLYTDARQRRLLYFIRKRRTAEPLFEKIRRNTFTIEDRHRSPLGRCEIRYDSLTVGINNTKFELRTSVATLGSDTQDCYIFFVHSHRYHLLL